MWKTGCKCREFVILSGGFNGCSALKQLLTPNKKCMNLVLPPLPKIWTTRKNLKNPAGAHRVRLGWAYHLAFLLEHKSRRLSRSLWIKCTRGEYVGERFGVQLHEVHTLSGILHLRDCSTLGWEAEKSRPHGAPAATAWFDSAAASGSTGLPHMDRPPEVSRHGWVQCLPWHRINWNISVP